jgi:hypothetical protein
MNLLDSLKQGDPRAIAALAVLLLLLSVGVFSKTLLFPPRESDIRYNTPSQPPAPGSRERLSRVLVQQREAFRSKEHLNPFYLDPPERRRRRRESPDQTSETNGSSPRPRPRPRPRTGNGDGTQAAPQPTVETITLVYNGLLVRPDGVTVAAVSIPSLPDSRFMQIGDEVNSFVVTDISKTHLDIQRNQKETVRLTRGSPQTFVIRP